MSDDADLDDLQTRIHNRMATLFRELCQRELLGGEETEALVRQVTRHPAALSQPGRSAPTPELRKAVVEG